MSAGGGRHADAAPIGKILNQLLVKKRFSQKRKHRRLADAWERAVGASVAQSTRIAGFRGGRLVVEVDSPAMLQELSGFMRLALLEELRTRPGGREVVDITFRLIRSREEGE